jgi:hypothetical protein
VEYQALGDPDEAVPMTKADVRRQTDAARSRDWVQRVADLAPPLTNAQAVRIAALLQSVSARELVTWRLRLFCGHVVERPAHVSHPSVGAAFHGSVDFCPTCHLSPAAIVAARALA